MRSQASEIEDPGKVRKEKKNALPLELISAPSLNTSNVRGLEKIFFKSAILFDFALNVLLRFSQCYLCRPAPK